ncbi:MAG TPA: hypothetical protein VF945_09700, partial [Polyangia bacterium]
GEAPVPTCSSMYESPLGVVTLSLAIGELYYALASVGSATTSTRSSRRSAAAEQERDRERVPHGVDRTIAP